MKRIVLLCVFSIVLTANLSAQTAKPEEVGLSSERLKRIRDLIEKRIEARDIAGAITVVTRKGWTAHFEAQGLMDIETNKPMAKDAIFRIASMTKPVIGVAILMLMEEGKVRLSDPVSRFIPEFKELKVSVPLPGAGPAPAAGARGAAPPRFYTVPAEREITVRDLLTHTSGLGSGEIFNAEAAKIQRKQGETLADYIPRLGQTPLAFQPGSRWTYSPGAGFDTLGRIVEVASGQKLDQFLQQRIFEPLGMKDTAFNLTDAQRARAATMYQRSGNALQKATEQRLGTTTYFSGGGGLASTAEDYAKFGQMLANGGQLNGKRLLGLRTVELMGSPFAADTLPGRARGEGWGLSVRVITNAAARNVLLSEGAFGWQGAFGTHFWVDPKEKLVGLLMVQTSNQEMIRDFETAVMQSIVD
jgi:CubicO group peptidase (beta-lactamase class C family)